MEKHNKILQQAGRPALYVYERDGIQYSILASTHHQKIGTLKSCGVLYIDRVRQQVSDLGWVDFYFGYTQYGTYHKRHRES